MKAGETYISKNECFGTWVNWFSNLRDTTLTEFDLLESQDGKISFWRLFYDQNFYQFFEYPKVRKDFDVPKKNITFAYRDSEKMCSVFMN